MPPSRVLQSSFIMIGGDVGATTDTTQKIRRLGLVPPIIRTLILQHTQSSLFGVRVKVTLTVENGELSISMVPTAAGLIIKALREPEPYRKKEKPSKGKREKHTHNGNISFDDVIEIARVMRTRSMAKEFAGTVKEILGTCVSVGCTVDGKDPKDLQMEIDDGDVQIPQD